MTVSDINTQSVASPPAAAPTLPTCSPCPPTPEWTPVQNGIAMNKYFIIKPPLLRTLHDCKVYKMKFPKCMNKAKNCYPFREIISIVNDRKYCPEILKY